MRSRTCLQKNPAGGYLIRGLFSKKNFFLIFIVYCLWTFLPTVFIRLLSLARIFLFLYLWLTILLVFFLIIFCSSLISFMVSTSFMVKRHSELFHLHKIFLKVKYSICLLCTTFSVEFKIQIGRHFYKVVWLLLFP